MERGSKEELQALLEHAGFSPTDAELEDMLRVHQVNQERLGRLHAADLDDEEVAGVFTPVWEGAQP